MRIRKFFSRKPGDPMGALNDLSFLLIIYFLVIAGFNLNTGFLMNLPEKDRPRIVHTEDLVRLQLDGSGLRHRGEALSMEALAELLADSLRARPNLTVALSIHPDVPYQAFIETVREIRESRVENYSFAMMEDASS